MSRFTSFLTAAIMSCGLVLVVTDVASAQHRGGGGRGGGGGHSSGGHYSGSHYGGGYHGGGHYYGGDGHYGGLRIGPSIIIGGGYPRYYDRGYYGGGYSYPSTVVETPYTESYYEPQPAPSVESAAATSIRVLLPGAGATLWMDGRRIDSTTDTHIFEFSNEMPGRMYTHKFTAAWNRDGQPVTEERTVQLAGGQSAVVDFNRPAPAAAPAPVTPPEENR